MRILIISFLLVLSSCNFGGLGQTHNDYNFDFEVIDSEIPLGWANNKVHSAGYNFFVDSLNSMSGKHSVCLEYQSGKIGFGSWSYTIPNSFKGRKITLSGYIKTQDVQNGYAGLWMRLDPNVALNNMSQDGVVGTTSWRKYSITLLLSSDATEEIVIGGILQGTGKAWFDNFSVQIDGTDIQKIKPDVPLVKMVNTKLYSPSGVDELSFNQIGIKNIKLATLVWGFIKYYHPAVRSGSYDIDNEFFRLISEISNTNNKHDRSQIILTWVQHFGNIERNKVKDTRGGEVYIAPDFDWINTDDFSPELVDLLKNIRNAHRNENCYYINFDASGKPKFTHENSYANIEYPDTGYRLLALARYWNIIQYFYPYKYLIGESWERILEDLIPKFIKADNRMAYGKAILQLIASINDTHAKLYPSDEVYVTYFGARKALPIINFVNNMPVITDMVDESNQNKIKVGDVIVSIDGKLIKDIISDLSPYIAASNYPTKLRLIASELLRSNRTNLEVEYLRGGTTLRTMLPTYSIDSVKLLLLGRKPISDTCYVKIHPTISYLDLRGYKSQYISKLWNDISSSTGLIIDLRGYPAEYVAYSLGSLLMDKPTAFFKVLKGESSMPGQFSFGNSLGQVGSNNPYYYKGKVVILVNEYTQSQAEFTVMALQVAPKAMVLGSTTAGADGDIATIELPGGWSTMISGVGIFYPDGRATQRVGIIPDIEVHQTINGIKSNKDELLVRAIEILR